MNFLADECCDGLLVEGLRKAGYDVLYVKETMPGADDPTVLQSAFDQNRILITEDKDFGELVVRFKLPAKGLILLRLNPIDSAGKLDHLCEILRSHADKILDHFLVVDPDKVRYRTIERT